MSSNDPFSHVYRVTAKAGTKAPGCPTLYLSLQVNVASGQATGHAVQTRPVEAPGDRVEIELTNGQVRTVEVDPFSKLVSLEGTALIDLPPPAIGSYLTPFRAQFAIDDAWSGVGGWTLGTEDIEEAIIVGKVSEA